jgi:hypothetical protein
MTLLAEMTRVPLTQPSTDLVEVTLDLILLIDQLLTVLRRRFAVLELTSLRLQWDDLRFEVSRESESVNAEIKYVVAEAQAWIPGAPVPDRERRGSTNLSVRPTLRSAASNNSLAESAAPATTPPQSPKQATRKLFPPSPPKQLSGPKSSLHLSILRSQLVGLQSRQRNFTITLVKRSTGILDKMIDAASRLDGLGGVMGPLADGERVKGAIPEDLIELQEAIEENAGIMSERVKWCGEFETQCRQAHQHYMGSLQAEHYAGEVLTELEKALAKPASSARHAPLTNQFKEAARALPPVLDANFPSPSHPEYPSKDEHNARLIEALQAARDAAQAGVDLAGKGLSFYSGMVAARDALLSQHQRVQTLRAQLAQTMQQLEHGTASVPRPSIEAVARDGGDCSGWLQRAAGWIATGDEVVRSATDTHQSTLLAAMQYRKALVSAPMAVKRFLPEDGVPDDLGQVVDDDTGDLIALAHRCAVITKSTRSASEAIPIVLGIRQDSTEAEESISQLENHAIIAINEAAWSSSSSTPTSPPPDLSEEMAKVAEKADEMDHELQRLKAIDASASVTDPLAEKAANVREGIDKARNAVETLNRVSEQSTAVRSLQDEAKVLLEEIGRTRETIPANKDIRAVNAKVAALKQRVTAWNDSLPKKVVFVSNNPPSLESSRNRNRANSGGPLTPPLTPVEITSAQGPTIPDLVALDGRVRNELIQQSARVSSALAHLVTAVEDAAFDKWCEPVVKATTTLEEANAKFETVMSDLGHTLDTIKAAEGEERKQLATEAQKTGREVLLDPIIEVQQCVASLNTALGSTASSTVNMRRASAIFSSADIAREAALARIAESEQWQKEVSRIALESDVLLQRQKVQLLKQKVQAALSRSAEQDSTARELVEKLDALDLDNIVRPSDATLRSMPKHRRLPTPATATELTASFRTIKDSARALDRSKKSADMDALLAKVKRSATLVSELAGLGTVSDAARACDDAFSALLETIDASDKDSKEKDKIKPAERKAETLVIAFKKAARAFRLDQRIMDEQKRIVHAWDDLRSVAEGEITLHSSTSMNGTNGTSGSSSLVGSISSLSSSSTFSSGRSRRSSISSSRTGGISRSATTGSLASILSDSTVVEKKKTEKAEKHARLTKPLGAARNVSMPPPELPKKVQPSEPRSRVVSVGDTPSKPSRKPPAVKLQLLDKPDKTLSKRVSLESVSTPRTPRPSLFGTFKPTIPQPFNLSGTPGSLTRSASATTSLAEMAGTPTRKGPRMSAPPRTPVFSATPKIRRPPPATTKLDLAMAKLLDTLDVDVPVVPVGRESPDQWQDESGRYWIGTGGKARLCFCRILRSRTVMVRVGGGWVELSRYLLDRFADALEMDMEVDGAPASARDALSMSPPDWRRTPMTITSANLGAANGNGSSNAAALAAFSSLRIDGSVPRTPARTPRTPARKSLPSFGTPLALALDPPTPTQNADGLSPSQTSPSPLASMRFMRKASDSPTVREKERAQLRRKASFFDDREVSPAPAASSAAASPSAPEKMPTLSPVPPPASSAATLAPPMPVADL